MADQVTAAQVRKGLLDSLPDQVQRKSELERAKADARRNTLRNLAHYAEDNDIAVLSDRVRQVQSEPIAVSTLPIDDVVPAVELPDGKVLPSGTGTPNLSAAVDPAADFDDEESDSDVAQPEAPAPQTQPETPAPEAPVAPEAPAPDSSTADEATDNEQAPTTPQEEA